MNEAARIHTHQTLVERVQCIARQHKAICTMADCGIDMMLGDVIETLQRGHKIVTFFTPSPDAPDRNSMELLQLVADLSEGLTRGTTHEAATDAF